ncbi:MAG: 50S ribosomal protein L9 [Dehalococcoidia bacterium]|nr:50S ribosomal protein L9 [Chloroflexota bacterium]MCK4242185.1 50S ribosomal protein L9 [Dehalococcoidia bacterium]
MRVVLLQDVPRLGSVGEVRDVASGYARNFLLPRGLAEFATPAAMRRVEAIRQAEGKRQALLETELTALAQTLEGVEITLKAKVGAQERLYGAVTNGDIAEELERVTGQDIDKRKIELEEPIRQLGEYEVLVRLSKGIAPKIKVVVTEEKG